jgi:hypothetical protein
MCISSLTYNLHLPVPLNVLHMLHMHLQHTHSMTIYFGQCLATLKLHSTRLQVHSIGRNKETNTATFQDFQHSKDAMHSNATNLVQLLILWIITTHFFLYIIFIIMHLFQYNFPSTTIYFTIISLTPCASTVWPGNPAHSWEEAYSTYSKNLHLLTSVALTTWKSLLPSITMTK